MTKHFKYSKGLHIATLLCFLMPFFNTSCEDKENAKIITVDTVKTTELLSSDTARSEGIEKFAFDTTALRKSIAEGEANTKKETSLPELFDNVPFLKPVLNPSEDIYSGLGMVIGLSLYVSMFSVFICFLLLIICLIIKFIERGAKKTIVVLDCFALISLLISRAYSLDSETLWGLWTCAAFLLLLTIYDFYLPRQPIKVDEKGSR